MHDTSDLLIPVSTTLTRSSTFRSTPCRSASMITANSVLVGPAPASSSEGKNMPGRSSIRAEVAAVVVGVLGRSFAQQVPMSTIPFPGQHDHRAGSASMNAS